MKTIAQQLNSLGFTSCHFDDVKLQEFYNLVMGLWISRSGPMLETGDILAYCFNEARYEKEYTKSMLETLMNRKIFVIETNEANEIIAYGPNGMAHGAQY